MKEKATFLSKLYTKGIQYRPDTCDIDIIKGQMSQGFKAVKEANLDKESWADEAVYIRS